VLSEARAIEVLALYRTSFGWNADAMDRLQSRVGEPNCLEMMAQDLVGRRPTPQGMQTEETQKFKKRWVKTKYNPSLFEKLRSAADDPGGSQVFSADMRELFFPQLSAATYGAPVQSSIGKRNHGLAGRRAEYYSTPGVTLHRGKGRPSCAARTNLLHCVAA